MDHSGNHATHEIGYAHGGLKKDTGWWGAFVIGLAGTILVTGIAPVIVTSLGASGIPITIILTLSGWLLCLFLAELSAMMPERTGGAPSYAYPAFRQRWPRLAKHINGFTPWAYWLGWFPVAPLNMILAASYLATLLGLNVSFDAATGVGNGFTPINTFIAWPTFWIAVVGIILCGIPALKGIRFGTALATTLAILSMIPLIFIAVAWMFNPSVADMSQLTNFPRVDGSGFFSDLVVDNVGTFNWLQVYIAYGFLLSWNVIAMEAAACYIGECANPDRDAKIAMNLEGGFGVLIYTLIPIAFVVVLGAQALADSTLIDPNTIFVTFAGKVFPSMAGAALNWIIALMLIVALALSALNAIMGSGRALYQLSLDGQFPKWFSKVNKHNIPERSMIFNIVCSLIVVLAGGAVEIYTFSNVGYVISFIPVLIGYYLLRQDKPDMRRPFKLPEFMKYVALLLAAFYFVFWLFGGLWYAQIGHASVYYWAGWIVLLCYLPLYWYRHAVEDKRAGAKA